MNVFPTNAEQPAAARRPRPRWLLPVVVTAAVLVLLLVFCGIYQAARDDKPSPSPVSTPTAALRSASPAASTVMPAPSAATTTRAATPQLPVTFADGTFEVGVDIAPGTYKTTVPGESFGCYWERQRNLSGGLDGIISNENLAPNAKAVVTIAKTDKGFKSQGCGTWTKTG